MNYCYFCSSNTADVMTCEPEKVLIGESTYSQIVCGQETFIPKINRLCSDCEVSIGKFHHPGCENEECPKCHKQIISCGCLEEE